MKRPLGVIGLVYLTALAVIFHFYSFSLVVWLCAAAATASVIAIIIRLFRKKTRAHLYVVASSLCVLAALLSIFLYQNFKVTPITSAYAGKEITVEGYICDELRFKNSFATCTIQAEKINGEDSSAKITFTMHRSYDIAPFDKLKVNLTPQVSDYKYQYSKGVYLYAYEQPDADLESTGEKKHNFKSFVFDIRQKMEGVFDRSLDENAASLCKAVLLGEKQALSADVRQDFTDTGMSYLIVVSGMHLAIVTFLLRKILNRLRVNRWVTFAAIAAFVLCFMAITGFPPSVMRSGIMLLICYLGRALFRDNDSINSLGVAALALTVLNPYSVGDVGMLLSFTATFGILMWATPIESFCVKKLHLEKPPTLPQTKSRLYIIIRILKRIFRWFIAVFSTSLAATLWVIPPIMLFFGRISPLSVIISLLAYPLTFAVLMLAFFFVIFSAFFPFVPFWGKVFAPPLNFLSHLLTSIISYFSKLPFSSIAADDGYFYIWLLVSAILVVIGYIIHARKTYIITAVMISLLTLTIGGSLTYLFADTSAELRIFRGGSGSTAAVAKLDNISLLSYGGNKQGREEADELLGKYPSIDYLILTGGRGQSLRYYASLTDKYEVADIIAYEKRVNTEEDRFEGAVLYGDNTMFTLSLNSDVKVKALALHGKTYQYLYSRDVSVLFLPSKAQISYIPEEMRKADYVIADGDMNNAELLNCKKLLTTGSQSSLDGAEEITDSYTIKLS